MGVKIPPDWPEIDDNKFYNVLNDNYAWDPGQSDSCKGPHFLRFTCCVPGWFLNWWIDNDFDCQQGNTICLLGGLNECRLVNIDGPFTDPACTIPV